MQLTGGSWVRWGTAGWVLGVVGATVAGCATRDRLTFPGDPGGPGGVGPVTTIDVPGGDTTVQAGPSFFVTGLVEDPTGLDTVYFRTEGGLSTFPPSIGGGKSLRFGLPLTTNGLSGVTITVRVFATDRDGNRGDTAVRLVTVQ